MARPGKPETHKQTPIPISSYIQSLETGHPPSQPLSTSSVTYWTDYSRTYFHPKSIIQLPDVVSPQSSSVEPATSFDGWHHGQDMLSSQHKDDDVIDNHLRPFVEECDLMQGMQMIASMDDGWGGFASEYMEILRDEYPKTSVWLFSPQDPSLPLSSMKRVCPSCQQFPLLIKNLLASPWHHC